MAMQSKRIICFLILFLCIQAIWIAILLPYSLVKPVPVSKLVNCSNHDDGVPSSLTRREDIKIGTNPPCYKVVYIWLNEHDTFHVNLIFKQVGRFCCPGLSCGVQIEYGRNLSKLAASDVVFLFYKSSWNWHELLNIKHQAERQKWVFWTSESPRHTNHRVIPLPEYTNTTYDYIMTYRKGATNKDAYLSEGGYGHFNRKTPSVQKNDTGNWATDKTRMVAWVSTNCYPSTMSYDRTGFVNALSRYVSVDKYGPCGSQPCKDLATCGLQKYRFYLALENSECADYITEKFWYNSLTLGLVPIVFGAPKEDYLKVAPPNSFIFVPDFPSIAKLAAYLVELSENDNLYNKYFEWKKEGSVTFHKQFSNLEPQRLCDSVVRRVLKDEEAERDQKGNREKKPLVNDWDKWWTKSCTYTVSGFPIPDE
ncbi:alpha-(1,3)-fucosyltransferase 7-like [Strongylocentrotus purpuratus]|uniref:Fucosyltransferase n=1 Tax=Strongylocentrotus purpuratus TaxID=7668 RepID=A0A7M7T5J3_STRPU|nr:alpha-(1,3)-fucosyltransferase 7-like [Strongylocentrotus purpuratus]